MAIARSGFLVCDPNEAINRGWLGLDIKFQCVLHCHWYFFFILERENERAHVPFFFFALAQFLFKSLNE